MTAPSGSEGKVRITVDDKPPRVVVDKYSLAAKANGGAFTMLTFNDEPEQTLIVYGTADEANVNREAAEALQQAIRASGTEHHRADQVGPRSHGRRAEDASPAADRPARQQPLTAEFAGELADLVRAAVVRGPRRVVRPRRQRRAGGGGEPVEPALFRGGDRGHERRRDAAGRAEAAGRAAAEVVVLPHGKPAGR